MKIMHPEFFWFFTGLPLIWVLYLFGHRRGFNSLLRLGYKKDSLLISQYRIRSFIRSLLLTAIYCFSLLALVDFNWGLEPIKNDNKNLDVAIVLDISNSMLANDVDGTRLDRTIDGIYLLMENLTNTRFSFTLFKGDGVVFIPLTEDLIALENLLTQVSPAMISSPGSDLEKALNKALSTLPQNQERSRAIMLFTDGENLSGNSLSVVRELYNRNIKLFTFGVGTTEGSQIVLPNGDKVTDREGQPVISRQNSSVLREMADMTGGEYLDLSEIQILGELENTLERSYGLMESRGIGFSATHRYRIFLAGALFFLLLYLFVGKLKWN